MLVTAVGDERGATPRGEPAGTHIPATYDTWAHIEGPFYHGTKAALEVGVELLAGYGSNYQGGRVSNHIYFSALVETAVWGAELATALAGSGERGHIYAVEPLGPFEDDPNVTNKRFPGNPTQSYRTHHPLRVLAEPLAGETRMACTITCTRSSRRRRGPSPPGNPA